MHRMFSYRLCANRSAKKYSTQQDQHQSDVHMGMKHILGSHRVPLEATTGTTPGATSAGDAGVPPKALHAQPTSVDCQGDKGTAVCCTETLCM